jgi:hypothetical protein
MTHELWLLLHFSERFVTTNWVAVTKRREVVKNEVGWLSRGSFDLCIHTALRSSITQCWPTLPAFITSVNTLWLQRFPYLADTFTEINEKHLSFQSTTITIVSAREKLSFGQHASKKMSQTVLRHERFFNELESKTKWRCSYRHSGALRGLQVTVKEYFPPVVKGLQ